MDFMDSSAYPLTLTSLSLCLSDRPQWIWIDRFAYSFPLYPLVPVPVPLVWWYIHPFPAWNHIIPEFGRTSNFLRKKHRIRPGLYPYLVHPLNWYVYDLAPTVRRQHKTKREEKKKENNSGVGGKRVPRPGVDDNFRRDASSSVSLLRASERKENRH